jgi:hypothetical protein
MFSGLNPGASGSIGDVIHLLNSARGNPLPGSEGATLPVGSVMERGSLTSDDFLDSLKNDDLLGCLNDAQDMSHHVVGVNAQQQHDPIAAKELANASYNLSLSLQKKHSILQEHVALTEKTNSRLQQPQSSHVRQPQPQPQTLRGEDARLDRENSTQPNYASLNGKYGSYEELVFSEDEGTCTIVGR